MANVRFLASHVATKKHNTDEKFTKHILNLAPYDHDMTFLKFCITDSPRLARPAPGTRPGRTPKRCAEEGLFRGSARPFAMHHTHSKT